VFRVDDQFAVGIHGSTGIQWDPGEHVGLFLEVGRTFFPGAAADLRSVWLVTAAGFQLRL
jgi:hypothetical protein